jgi:chromosomal replication initiator protein
MWKQVQSELALAVDETTYRVWLEPLRARELHGEHLLVEAPPQACGWIRDRFGRVLQRSAARVIGAETVIELVAFTPVEGRNDRPVSAGGPAERGPVRERGRAAMGGSGGSLERGAEAEDGSRFDFGPSSGPLGNPKLTFEQFVIGDSNRLAHAAALAVAEMPSQAYNPLFICGPPGVGKTHLLSAIASLLLAHSPGLSVRATTGEAFTNEFLSALSDGRTELFKSRFRDVDVLLMDDVQFLERKTKTEEEFFHTFNALHDGGRQVVLTSDRPPRDLQALEDRLRERFQAGLVADVEPPDLATRVTILRKRADHDRVVLADGEALQMIAERIDTNVRALEGALIRIVAFSSLTGRPLTGDLAREVLDSLYPRGSLPARSRERSVKEIQTAACAHFGISSEELLSTGRTARVTWPRQVAMFLARELTGESLPAIGRQFGGRDHTTVLHACRRTATRISEDDVLRDTVDRLRASLRSDERSVGSVSASADRGA